MSRMIDPFYVMEVAAAAQAKEATGAAVYHLEVGQPSTGAPAGAIARAHELLDAQPLGYTVSRGIPELAPAIANHINASYGVDVDPARIAVTQGATGAFILTLLAALEEGARVAVTAPGYPCYRNILTALHMQPVQIDVDAETRFQPTIEQVEAMMPLDGIIIASPANPTGTMLTPTELSDLTRWCEGNGVRLFSDEIYHGLTYDGPDTATATQFSDEAVVINSFSKYFSMTGWRIGWTVLPDELITPVDRLAQNLVICPPVLSKHVALAAFDCGEELEFHVSRYAENRAILLEGLPEAGLTEFAPADGAFYIWARTDHLAEDSQALAAVWLDELGIAATPGIDFHPTQGHRFMRLSFSGSTESMHAAVGALQGWYRERIS